MDRERVRVVPESLLSARPGGGGHDTGGGTNITLRQPALRRNRIEDVVAEGLLLRNGLHVDRRRLSHDSNGFLELADLQFRVDRRGKRRGQLQPFSLDGRESHQAEGNDVCAGPQVDDSILPLTVRHGRTSFFDERRARRFDCYAREDGSGCVPYQPGDRTLSQGDAGKQEKDDEDARCFPGADGRRHRPSKQEPCSVRRDGMHERRMEPPGALSRGKAVVLGDRGSIGPVSGQVKKWNVTNCHLSGPLTFSSRCNISPSLLLRFLVFLP